jgi:hypothetical protein
MKTSTSAIVGAVLLGWIASPAVAFSNAEKSSASGRSERALQGVQESDSTRDTGSAHAGSCGCAACCALQKS